MGGLGLAGDIGKNRDGGTSNSDRSGDALGNAQFRKTRIDHQNDGLSRIAEGDGIGDDVTRPTGPWDML